MAGYPSAKEEISPQWLSEHLKTALGGSGCRVLTVSTELHPNQGALSQVIRLGLTWDCGGVHSEPARLIAKLPSAFASVRAFAARSSLYSNEARWYQEFGADPGIPIPRVYAASVGKEPEEFFILMEDMFPATPGSARPTLDLVELGVDALVGFHARWWQADEILTNSWLPGVDLDRDDDLIRRNEAELREAAEANRLRYAERYPDYLYRSAKATAAAFRRIRERAIRRPRTLLHGDFTTRQFFLPVESGGRFAVGDWQTASVGPGAEDLCRHLSIQLDPDTRRANESRLVERYYRGLVERGVHGYSLDELWEDFRWSLWRTLWVQTRAFAAVDDAQVERVRARAAANGEPDPQGQNAATLAACLHDHDYLALLAS
jgi:aminoglycoside phosphotransferase (APT) family kinase protein